jgi:hypothetical protein
MPYRFAHMMLASFLTVSFLIAGVSAFRWLIGDRSREVRSMLKTGVALGALLIPVQIFMGDLHGLNTKEYQPAKVAAMEGLWETARGAPLVLFAIPDDEARENRFAVEIPGLASLILTHEWDGELTGLNDFVTEEGEVLHPPVAPVFWSFRVMVGTGVAMLLVSWTAVLLHVAPPPPARRADRGPLVRGRGPAEADPLGAGADGLLGLGRHARGLVHDRDRAPALAGAGRDDDRDGRGRGARADGDGHARDLPRDLRGAALRLYRRGRLPRAQGRAGGRRPANDMTHSGKAQVDAISPAE